MKRLALAVVVAISLAGCGGATHRKPLPKPLFWYGTAIWVPTNSAAAFSHAVCEQQNYSYQWPYHTAQLPSGGELMTCDDGTKGY